ncbi:MAG: hypothetical protein Q8O84_04225 [Nanoarchaeota archaeon]|nr:hypothetical protein [Nanoarchaeota archaeon]
MPEAEAKKGETRLRRKNIKSKDYLENQDKQLIVKELEKKIDKMVYELYELTPEEIEIVENFNKK